MTVWIALLRAVNVGGRRVKMAELREACEHLGFRGVRTYIASGNVALAGPQTEPEDVQAVLQDGLRAHWGFEVPVVVRTAAQLHGVIAGLPFDSPEQVSVSFLLQQPDPAWVRELQQALINDAEMVVEGLHAYVRTPQGLAQPFLAGPAARRFASAATAGTSRNWRTTVALAELGDQVAAAVTGTA